MPVRLLGYWASPLARPRAPVTPVGKARQRPRSSEQARLGLIVVYGTALGGLQVCLFYLEQAEVELRASQAVDGAALFAQLDEVVHTEALEVREALG